MTTAPTTSPAGTTVDSPPLQPLLSDALIVLRAPTQVWSDGTGDMGAGAVHGVYHGDVRHVRALTSRCDGSPIEWISTAPDGASRVVFGGLLRGLDDTTPDPKVRLLRDRRVDDGVVSESWTLHSRVDQPIRTTLRLALTPEFAQLHEVKSGHASARNAETVVEGEKIRVDAGAQGLELVAPGARVTSADHGLEAEWDVEIAPFGAAEIGWTLTLRDDTLVVGSATAPVRWDATAVSAGAPDPRPRPGPGPPGGGAGGRAGRGGGGGGLAGCWLAQVWWSRLGTHTLALLQHPPSSMRRMTSSKQTRTKASDEPGSKDETYKAKPFLAIYCPARPVGRVIVLPPNGACGRSGCFQ